MSKFTQTIEGQVGKTVEVIRAYRGAVNLMFNNPHGLTGGLITVEAQNTTMLALAVMNAAHGDKLPSWDRESADFARQEALNWLITAQDREAKEAEQASQDAARDRQRDELAKDLCDDDVTYDECAIAMQRAIDHIIHQHARLVELQQETKR